MTEQKSLYGERIVILGGGFAGFWAAIAARRVAPQEMATLLVSRGRALVMRPRLYEANPETLQVDLVPLLEKTGIDFTLDDAIGLDHESRELILASGRRIGYTRLVVATGSALRRPPIPGADQVYSIDSLPEAIQFDGRLAEIGRNNTTPTIAVVGAGFTGIELALELRDRLLHHGATKQAENARIVLIDRAHVIGSELGAGPRPVIEAALAQARVDLRLGVAITGLARSRIQFAGNESVAADAVVLTTGLMAAEFVHNVPGKRDSLGRILVDRHLRAPATAAIFVAGDAAAVDGGDGHIVLQSCQHALQLGRFAGENAARDLLGQPLIPYVQPPYITCLDLGRFGAVFTRGWERTVERTGFEAKLIKRRINTVDIYPPVEASGEELLAMSSANVAKQRHVKRSAA